MKTRFAISMTLGLCFGVLAMAADSSWTGYITDSKCGAKAAHDGARECTIKCAKAGAKYVFVNDLDKKVYTIDDQDKVAEHAGHHVTVTGSIDGDTLKLSAIDMAPAKSK
jgi:SpoU rRNA methylase family enzyme